MHGKDGLLMVDFSSSKTCQTFQIYFGILALAEAKDISAFSDGAKPS
jgi:hypothetical protein